MFHFFSLGVKVSIRVYLLIPLLPPAQARPGPLYIVACRRGRRSPLPGERTKRLEICQSSWLEAY